MRDRDRGLFRAEQPSRSLSAEADSMTSSPIEQALTALRHGQLVIVADALDRENEGDLIFAAETMTHAVATDRNTAPHKTPFLIQVDHREAGTGVSPNSRAMTIRALADPRSTAADFVQPGHVSPCWRRKGACSAAPAIPRRPSICSVWPA
jgi:3,4-dihydroxy 2-butanone 4-phosphate synthase / GTP cyclohydrolase II